MKAKTLALSAFLFAVPGLVLAADKIVHYPFANGVTAATQSGKLDGTVKFYLAGNQPNGQVTIVNDDIEITRRTNAFWKADQKTCDWALQSVLISLQDEAKKAGANAVVDIVSNFGNEYSDPQNYECHVGFLMSGVVLKAKLAKVQ
ncbi:excinuclease [Dyella psychrodurans]|uniref:Excinuclease n=1 Tax=Dyella psychrodurans TaxID=1927960 RepID=A0A370XBP5_9GAMM|nr:excinuclease [Dyella psychrodurans]RDS85625.1 excinuclease [Dyella psychrodurans]